MHFYTIILLLFTNIQFSLAFNCRWFATRHRLAFKARCEDQEEHDEYGCLFKPKWRVKEYTATMVSNGCLVEDEKNPTLGEGGLVITYRKTYCRRSPCGTMRLPYLRENVAATSKNSGSVLTNGEGPSQTQQYDNKGTLISADNWDDPTRYAPPQTSGPIGITGTNPRERYANHPGEGNQGKTDRRKQFQDDMSEDDPSSSYMDSSTDANTKKSTYGKGASQRY